MASAGEIDIVHGLGASVLGYATAPLDANARVPLVLNPQGLEEFGATDPSRAPLKRLGYWPLRVAVRRAAHSADRVIATDRSLVGPVITHLEVSKEAVRVIPNAIEPAECDRPDSPSRGQALRAELGLQPEDVLLVSVGRLEANKGFDVLIRALGALVRQKALPARWRWVLVGDGPMRESLQRASGCGRTLVIRGDARPRQRGRPPRLVRGVDAVRASDAVRRQLDCHARSHGASPGGRGEPRGRSTRQSHPGRHRLAGSARQRGSPVRGDCQKRLPIRRSFCQWARRGERSSRKISHGARRPIGCSRSTPSCSTSEIRCRLQACSERSRVLWPRIPTLKIRSVNRLTLDRELRRQFHRLDPGVVLDVGAKAAPYAAYVRAQRYVRLDIDPAKKPDICCDLHELEWRGEPFDTVLAIEVLEHLYDPQRAIDRIHGVLKTGGICILSTRFMYRYHPDPQDHYRFTWDSLKYLFRTFPACRGDSSRQSVSGDLGNHQCRRAKPRRPEPPESARCAVQLEPHEVPARVRRVRPKVSRAGNRTPRHALDTELTPALPDAQVRAAMAAFYKTNEGYALQQASHTAAYFDRLLGVIDAVLVQRQTCLCSR